MFLKKRLFLIFLKTCFIEFLNDSYASFCKLIDDNLNGVVLGKKNLEHRPDVLVSVFNLFNNIVILLC